MRLDDSSRQPGPPRVEMLPLMDTVFLLLVFFIHAMLSMAVHHGQDLDLPVSRSSPLQPGDGLELALSAGTDGALDIRLDGRPLAPGDLEEALRQGCAPEAEAAGRELRLLAEDSLDYGQVFHTLETARRAGCGSIVLIARQGDRAP